MHVHPRMAQHHGTVLWSPLNSNLKMCIADYNMAHGNTNLKHLILLSGGKSVMRNDLKLTFFVSYVDEVV